MSGVYKRTVWSSNGFMDRQDVLEIDQHARQIAQRLASTKGRFRSTDHVMSLCLARAVRVIQRATIAEGGNSYPCYGIDGVTYEDDNGSRCAVIHTQRGNIVIQMIDGPWQVRLQPRRY